ncbi:histidine triad-like protein [Chaetomium sp. MPI-CAGE-AT-0009]|nr:histidine triad-like protein [Chaetomium sp. MPI-CAGE-AT-0009]
MSSSIPSTAQPPAQQKQPQQPIHFGPFEVTSQVFLTTPHSFALVNLKPLLPGHVLVCPLKPHRRLTDLSTAELTDLFTSVQRVQRMLARHYFLPSSSPPSTPQPPLTPTPTSTTSTNTTTTTPTSTTTTSSTTTTPGGTPGGGLATPTDGSFNIAVQDGAGAGQTVAHVHVHVIPRIRGATAKPASTPSDAIYGQMAAEEGNVGGALWDRDRGVDVKGGGGREGGREIGGVVVDGEGRPVPGGSFPRIEDAERVARGMQDMEAEAAVYKRVLEGMERDGL